MCRRSRGLSGLAAEEATDAMSEQEAGAVDDGDDDADDEEDHIGDGPLASLVRDEAREELEARHGHLNEHEERVSGGQPRQADQLREHHRKLREEAAAGDAEEHVNEQQRPRPSLAAGEADERDEHHREHEENARAAVQDAHSEVLLHRVEARRTRGVRRTSLPMGGALGNKHWHHQEEAGGEAAN